MTEVEIRRIKFMVTGAILHYFGKDLYKKLDFVSSYDILVLGELLGVKIEIKTIEYILEDVKSRLVIGLRKILEAHFERTNRRV